MANSLRQLPNAFSRFCAGLKHGRKPKPLCELFESLGAYRKTPTIDARHDQEFGDSYRGSGLIDGARPVFGRAEGVGLAACVH